ncbi:DUF421 domain-containing protein [Brevundimonas diminuta]|uniref:DUF421 domain-containing protein n=1 Tax=Brevundimonas diminuta TaxID=293 RepID=UPI002097D15B|nr:YetF domain-containing protein [Brevundimonas diminuta]MCO8029923.1 DUF421 domain-containing protein [Brevundimonas diminuta]
MNERATADEGGLPGLAPVAPKLRFRKVEAVGVSIIAAVVFLGAIGFIKPEESNGLDLVVRVTIIFIALTAGFRFLGKRELSQMSPFEIVTLLLIAEIVSPSLTAGDESIPGALIGAATLLLLTFIDSVMTYRLKWFQTVSEAPPTIVINRGRLVEDVLHKDRVRPDEILSEMRKSGIERLEMVKWGVLEPDGRMSFVRYDGEDTGAEEPMVS